jgi:hypothetical protein
MLDTSNNASMHLLTSHTVIGQPNHVFQDLWERGHAVTKGYRGSGFIAYAVIRAADGPYAGRCLLWLRQFVPV